MSNPTFIRSLTEILYEAGCPHSLLDFETNKILNLIEEEFGGLDIQFPDVPAMKDAVKKYWFAEGCRHTIKELKERLGDTPK